MLYLESVIGPATKLHFTLLVVKWKPRNVNLACALEDARRDVQAASVVSDNHVGGVSPVEPLVRTEQIKTPGQSGINKVRHSRRVHKVLVGDTGSTG